MNHFSMNMIKRAVVVLSAGTAILAAGASWAADDTATLTVNASVAPQCSVGNATLSLGALTLVSANGTMSVATGGSTVSIPWACTNGTTAKIGFDMGANAGGGSVRRMASATAGIDTFVEYELKEASSAGNPIATDLVTVGTGDGSDKTFTVWGGPIASATTRQAKPDANYTDAVLMTISVDLGS
jgi:spore coat protein U-like protein